MIIFDSTPKWRLEMIGGKYPCIGIEIGICRSESACSFVFQLSFVDLYVDVFPSRQLQHLLHLLPTLLFSIAAVH